MIEPASATIMRLRHAAGVNPHTCPTCGHARSAPRRRVRDGDIVEGCVDASHTGWVRGPDLAWHDRAPARAIRAREAARLEVTDP